MNLTHRPTLTIDLGALVNNWRALNAMSSGGAAAVVKANAYGLGIVECAQALSAAGANRFFVATMEEGCALRACLGPDPWIGVLEGLSNVEAFDQHGLIPMINTVAQAQSWVGRDEIALHIDTGMNRLGLSHEDAVALLNSEMWTAPKTALLMSHLSSSEDPTASANTEQLRAFNNVCTIASSRSFTRSLINSSGHFLGPDFLDIGLSRPGLALYGGNPTPDFANPMQAVVSLTAPLVQVRTIEAGTPVGYGGTWVAERTTVVGVIALGYADGWPRAASDNVVVRLGDRLCPQIGRVSMDTVMLDITDAAPLLHRIGETIQVIGEDLPLERYAEGAGTLAYEILTGLSRRAKRAYLSPMG